jgi:hypothetical protein
MLDETEEARFLFRPLAHDGSFDALKEARAKSAQLCV